MTHDDEMLAWYERGVQDGWALGYREALAVLDDAGALLGAYRADTRPPVDELRRRRATFRTPALTAAEIRARAAASWATVAT